MLCKRICFVKNKEKTGSVDRPRSFLERKNYERDKEKKSIVAAAVAVMVAVARRSQQRSKRSIFVKAEQKRDDDGESAAAENVGAERTVFRAENK